MQGTLSKQAQQVLRKILLTTCNMSNQNAWSFDHKKFSLDLARRARHKGGLSSNPTGVLKINTETHTDDQLRTQGGGHLHVTGDPTLLVNAV